MRRLASLTPHQFILIPVHSYITLHLATFPTMSEGCCEICKKPSIQKCSACHNAYYCSKEHQKSGWKTHKKDCRPYKVKLLEFRRLHLPKHD